MNAQMLTARKKVLIIGAGLAGMSLATELLDEGFEVELLEKNLYLGGRASDLVDHKMHDPVPIGPHVFVGWYNNFFRFLRKIDAQRLIEWEREVLLEVVHRGRHHKIRFYKNLPAPLFSLPWIATNPFLSMRDKLSNLGLLRRIYFSSIRALEGLDGMDAQRYLKENGVSDRSIDMFWRFIVLSLLNVPLERCSAAEFALLVKRWAYLRRRKFGFPKIGLGDIYADEAEKYIHKRGGHIHRGYAVTKIHMKGGKIDSVDVEKDGVATSMKADLYVSTLNPIQLRDVLDEELRSSRHFAALDLFEPVPYMSVNIWFDKKVTHKKFWAMLSGPGMSPYLNTDFYDLSNIYETHHGGGSYIASNIIFSEKYQGLHDDEIVRRTLEEIKETFPHTDAKPVHSHVHRTPYVIYAPIPGSRMHKLPQRTPIWNFYLAGDWTVREIPQCMEAAVRSGYKCAEEIFHSYGKAKRICDDRVF